MTRERLDGLELRHRFEMVNGVRLHWVEAGSGPLVVLLHGFPDFWYTWRGQIPALVSAGRRVVALDLRGYNESERPEGTDQYALDLVARDVIELIRLLSEEAAARGETGDAHVLLVGHDWGGVVAWRVASLAPEMLRGLVILNAPHPGAFMRELRRGPQLLRSWYALAFQIPVLPETLLGAFDFAVLRRMWRASGGPLPLDDADLERYRAAFAPPGALRAAVDYYRAAGRRMATTTPRGSSKVRIPTLVVWGARDPALSIRLTHDLERWVPDLRLEVLPDSGHWVQIDAPGTVNDLLRDFDDPSRLAASRTPA